MYALHEYGESHDESSENGSKKSGASRLDNIATPEDVNAADDTEGTNNECAIDDCQPSKINPNASVNFNMEGLKDMLKCANCHRFLFPPILQ